jgi:hypothetical protein
MTNDEEYARRDDALMREFLNQLKEQSTELGKLTAQYHSIEVQLATLSATNKGRDDQTHYRLSELEAWRNAATKYMITFMLTVAAGFVGMFIQAYFHGGGK